MQNLYPPKPTNISAGITNPGPAFRKEVVKVFFLCVLFLLWYGVLLLATIGIAFLFGFLGVLLVSEVQAFATLMIALGAIIMGIMLVFFMLKALVFKKTVPIPSLTQITPDSEPAFYNFIKKVCEETNAAFPKKIFLVDDVNAFVSYDSIFLSLFLPARKNLYIGLGLINASTISELKAVIAHEFGHFSQGSMRFGSYVYHFNQIIYRMVADNTSYEETLQKWANISGYFSIFAYINVRIIQAIQWLMTKSYAILNKGYMGLARQMEFHADAVAASVSGSAPLITSLYRMDLASSSYDHLLNYYNGLVKENLRADNLYAHHFKLMQLLAERENVKCQNGFPMIDGTSIDQLGRSSIVLKDQWASHPSVEDREAALRKLNIDAEPVNEPAWMLFNDAVAIQTANTERLYLDVTFSGAPTILTEADFELRYKDLLRLKNFQPEYKSYYNNRQVARFDLNLENYTPEDLSLDDLFSEEYTRLPKTITRMEGDIALLDSISTADSGYKSFDFEGSRYSIGDAFLVREHLAKELAAAQARLKEHDQEVYYIARRNESVKGKQAELENAYSRMFGLAEQTDKDIKLYNELAAEVTPVYSKLPVAEIKVQVLKIIKKEKEVKLRIAELLQDEQLASVIELKEDVNLLQKLYNSQHLYFNEGKYYNEELDVLNEAANAFLNIILEISFLGKKKALEIQINLLKPAIQQLKAEGY